MGYGFLKNGESEKSELEHNFCFCGFTVGFEVFNFWLSFKVFTNFPKVVGRRFCVHMFFYLSADSLRGQ